MSGAGLRLCDMYDVAMLDLDGVLYVGLAAVPGAPEAVARARAAGMRTVFLTNNASRTPEVVARQLAELGVEASPADVVTSAQAAARELVRQHGEGTRIAVLGGDGLWTAVREAGLEAVGVDNDADALVTGYGPDVPWRDVMRAAVLVRDGLPWVASNTDQTIPTDYGVAPGHGVQVDLIRRFSGCEPVVAGKPEAPLFETARARFGSERPLMVGDRLDTDIAGARRAGIDALLVLTGISTRAEAEETAEELQPTYVADDLGALLRPASEVTWRSASAVETGSVSHAE